MQSRVLCVVKLLSVVIFARLVSDTTACFASGLARCLALTTTTVLCAFAKIACLDCLNMLHVKILRNISLLKV